MTTAPTDHPPPPPIPGAEAAIFCAAPELGLLAFAGPDAEAFLQGQLSNDIRKLDAGAAQLTSYNSPKGRMLATLLIWRDGPETFRALVAADLAEPVRKRLSMYVLRAKLTVSDLSSSHALLGLAGARATDVVRAAFDRAPDRGHVVAADTASLVGLPDGRIVVVVPLPSAEALRARFATEATAVAPEFWRWIGIRAGVPVIGAATQDLFVLQAANWELLGGVSFQKGCYPGQEIVARTQYLGRQKERMHLFHVAGPPPQPATKIYGAVFADQACGTVVDAARAPEGGSDLLAVLQSSALEGALRVGAPDGPALAPLPLPYSIPEPAASHRPKM